MASSASDHKALVREEFTRQAAAYASAALLADPERVARLVQALSPAPDARALEVATGPGHVALILAQSVGEMVGIDITEAPLAIAEERRQSQGLANVRFETGDADHLAFGDAEFDLVLCRLAFHHFQDPSRVLAEMTRVCRPGGTVAVEDVVVSEHSQRAAYQNRFENLRDPSHTSAFSLSALLRLFAGAGLEVERVSTDTLVQTVEDWFTRAQTPPHQAEEARRLLEADERRDLSGTRPHRLEGVLRFSQRTAIVVGRKLSPAAV